MFRGFRGRSSSISQEIELDLKIIFCGRGLLPQSLRTGPRVPFQPVSTNIVVRNLRLNGCLDAVLFSLLVSECVSSGCASVSLRVGNVYLDLGIVVTFYSSFYDLLYAARLTVWDSVKFLITDSMNFVRTPGEAEGRWPWRGLAAGYVRCFPSCPCTISGPWSCRPQPLGSGGDATLCKDPRQEHGSLFNYVAGVF